MNTDTQGLSFDDEQKVHILPPAQRDETERIVKAAKEYQDALVKFDTTSTKIIAQIDKLAQATEAKRGQALSLKALN